MLVALRDRSGVGNLDVSFIEARHRVSRDLLTSASFPYGQESAEKKGKIYANYRFRIGYMLYIFSFCLGD